MSQSDSILVITQYFPPETGACSTRWDEITRRWADERSVTVLTSAPDYPEGELYDGYHNDWIRVEERDGVRVIYTKTLPSSSGNLVRRAMKFVWFMLLATVVGLRYASPGRVVATSPQPLTGVAAWGIARWNGARFVFDVRDLWPESVLAVSEFDNRAVIWLLERTVRLLYRRCDLLVVVSEAFVDPIREQGIDPTKISYHPNGIDPDFYQGEEPSTEPDDATAVEDDSETPDVVTDQFTVSYIGTIGRAHGLSVVFDAAPQLPDVQFVLVGDGAEREQLQQQAASLDNVTFVGKCPKAEVPSFLSASDVSLVHLKPREVFETVIPTKLLEAMAASRPVVLGVSGHAQQILDAAEAGVAIEPGDADELVDAIEELQTDDERRERLGTNGRQYVVEQFDWDRIATRYLSDIDGSTGTN